LTGDFNEIASPGEKKEGLIYPLSKYARLNSFTNEINAISVPSKGNCFTWKKKIPTYLVYERLDRAIIRSDWLNIYPESIVTHGQFTCSDHCPIVLTTAPPNQRRKNFPFRFQNAWCQYRQVQNIVDKQWKSTVQGTRMFKLAHNLKNTKYQVKNWAHQFLGNTQHRLKTNLQKIDNVEGKLVNQPDNLRLNSWLNRLLR